MSNNFVANAGSGGSTFASNDVGGIQYPRVKMSFGVDGAAVDVSASNPLPVSQVSAGLTNKSGSVTTGGTAQTLAAANASRKGFAIQNQSTGDLWINEFGASAAATQPSMKLIAGAYYESPPGGGGVGAVSVFGATTGQAFSAKEW